MITHSPYPTRPLAVLCSLAAIVPARHALAQPSVSFPLDGSFAVHVPERSAQGDPVLEIHIDDANAPTQPLPNDTDLPWSYWKPFTVPVAAGPHKLRVSNSGSGTFWATCELGNYRHRQGPDLDI